MYAAQETDPTGQQEKRRNDRGIIEKANNAADCNFSLLTSNFLSYTCSMSSGVFRFLCLSAGFSRVRVEVIGLFLPPRCACIMRMRRI